MENLCNFGNGCCWTTYVGMVAWWVVASGLVWITWNRVIGTVAKVKAVKYWHSLVLLLTLSVLVIPRWLLMSHHHGHGHCHHQCHGHGHCAEMNHHCSKDHCPEGHHGHCSHGDGHGEPNASPEPAKK